MFYVLLLVIIFDFIVSIITLKNIKRSAEKMKKDDIEELHRLVIEKIKEKSWKYRRLFNAYHTFE